MRTVAAAVCAVLVLGLTGCASAPDTDPGPTMAEVGAGTAGQDEQALTGSRLAKRSSTDRMLKTVGAQGAKDELRNVPRTGASAQ
ncbi:hypothetical protein [Massilia sp. H6]|uniref:hypothetical protein n=1 Tax=Massilia sp. H6 TaxID=2970464 RepID=UPI002168812B|nr:hypothetical protein [Massilia sp. H6]UVW27873.1 hypothetical protein NRS07_15165 [Massilia sp. H6]